jgi:hypothetical protein
MTVKKNNLNMEETITSGSRLMENLEEEDNNTAFNEVYVWGGNQ